MITVLATGVFDLLHPGHIHYLTEARNLGDRLAVVVAADETAQRIKRHPVMPAQDRLLMVQALRVVDEAFLGEEGNRYTIVKQIKPDIIALGYDQQEQSQVLTSELKQHGIEAQVTRIDRLEGHPRATTDLLQIVKARS